jgi:hypothetical protein
VIFTLKTTRYPATDLGYLLHKNPANLHSFDLSIGKAHVFFPETEPDQCCAALLLDIDPISLVKKKRGHFDDSFNLEQYVNDRPYVASSFLSMAIARVFRDALKGVCKEKPELLSEPWPFEGCIAALPSQSKTRSELIRSLFEPLGYQVTIEAYPLNEKNPDWWLQLTEQGGEGMVVKPYDFTVVGSHGLIQPGLKCRGREYLRIIYGPEYTIQENLERLKSRNIGKKRSLALREYALGVEALERFVRKEPLYKFHEAVFGVLALESEPIDPRL